MGPDGTGAATREDGDANSPRVLVAFLGTGNYVPVRYALGDTVTATEHTFVQAALAELQRAIGEPVDRAVVLHTEEAYAKHGGALHDAFRAMRGTDAGGQSVEPTFVAVPAGRSTDELWLIVATLLERIPPRSTVVFDITHGFRSLPFIAAIAFQLLRTTHGIDHASRIYYGAFEVIGTPQGVQERRARGESIDAAPVFDLTPLLDVAAWGEAATVLARTGNARDAVARITALRRDLGRLTRGTGPTLPVLDAVSAPLRRLHAAASLVRSDAVAHFAHQLVSARREPNVREAGPFGVVAASIAGAMGRSVEPLARYADVARPADFEPASHRYLEGQLAIARWYFEHDRLLEGLVVLREAYESLLVALACKYVPGVVQRVRERDPSLADFRSTVARAVAGALASERKPREPGAATGTSPAPGTDSGASGRRESLSSEEREALRLAVGTHREDLADIDEHLRERRNRLMHGWTGVGAGNLIAVQNLGLQDLAETKRACDDLACRFENALAVVRES
jgi:CRISPR-associated DxTHG motif protein